MGLFKNPRRVKENETPPWEEITVIRRLHVAFNGFPSLMCQWKNTAVGVCVCLLEREFNQIQAYFSDICTVTHQTVWSPPPPFSPWLWNVLVCSLCSAPKRIKASWMQSRMYAHAHLMHFSPFTQCALVTRAGDEDEEGDGRRGVGGKPWEFWDCTWLIIFASRTVLFMGKEEARGRMHTSAE